MNAKYRANVVRAMDLIAGTLNDEELLMPWFSMGVADGDITPETTDEDLECYYEDDEDFAGLMHLFLELMTAAEKRGGLYCDRVVSR